MALIPYSLVLEATLTSGGTATVSYPVPVGESLELTDMIFVSTGIFNITGIRDSSGRNYTNASLSVEIPSSVLKSGANAFNAHNPFSIPLVIEGGTVFYIDLEDSSAAGNTVTIVCEGKRNTQA